MLCVVACAPREWLLPKVGLDPPKLWDYPADFEPPISNSTNRPMPGFGGSGPVTRTPMIFIHGNGSSAGHWLPVREHFKSRGYQESELWAMTYGWNNARYYDSHSLSVPSIERIVNSVTDYLSKKSGRKIHQVDLMGHSLGVTVVREWMKQTNSWHRVRSYIGAAGGNQGSWLAISPARGQNRISGFEFLVGGPALKQLNRGGQTPGPTRYMTSYDGTGWADAYFAPWQKDSGALEGAYNVAYNREYGTYYDHFGLSRKPEVLDLMLDWLAKAPEAIPRAEPPKLVREGDVVRADQAGAQVHCSNDGNYPTAATPGADSVRLAEIALYTCYARNPDTELSSPMARFKAAAPRKREPLMLTATPKGGAFENPVFVELQASDPDAFIVYNTAGVPVSSGSPLYTEPVYVPGPLVLTAVAIAPDGRTSEAVTLEFDISLELVEANNTLQRQFDPGTPAKYEGKRAVGR
jgi:pimeloyl-ACP methyl ester carboxylesterase